MANILRISEAASLAIHALVLVAERETNEPVNASKIAQWLSASEAHLAKIFQWLAKGGLVTSQRGPKGGFKLAKDPAQISLLDIIVAIDGPFPTSTCLLGRSPCRPACRLIGTLMEQIHAEVLEGFSKITIKSLLNNPECSVYNALTKDNPSRSV
jgi:Rrf2 family protein